MYCKKYGYILESLDIEELKLCRNEKELRKYLKSKGINLTRAQACELKVFYCNNFKSSEMLNIETLNYVAGGMKAAVKTENRSKAQEHFIPPAIPDFNHDVTEQQIQNKLLSQSEIIKLKVDKGVPPLPPRPDEQHVRQLEQQVLKNQLLSTPKVEQVELTHQHKTNKAALTKSHTERTHHKGKAAHKLVQPEPKKQAKLVQLEQPVKEQEAPVTPQVTEKPHASTEQKCSDIMNIHIVEKPASKESILRSQYLREISGQILERTAQLTYSADRPKTLAEQQKQKAQVVKGKTIVLGKVSSKPENQPVNEPKVEHQLEQNQVSQPAQEAEVLTRYGINLSEDAPQVHKVLARKENPLPKVEAEQSFDSFDDPYSTAALRITTVQPSEKAEQIGEAAASAAAQNILVEEKSEESVVHTFDDEMPVVEFPILSEMEEESQGTISTEDLGSTIPDLISSAIEFGWDGQTHLEETAMNYLGDSSLTGDRKNAAEFLALYHDVLSSKQREGLSYIAVNQVEELRSQQRTILNDLTESAKGKPIEGLVCHIDQLWKIVEDADKNATEFVKCDYQVYRGEKGKLYYIKDGEQFDCTNNVFKINGIYYRFFDPGKDKQSDLKLVPLKRYESEMQIGSSDPVYSQDEVKHSNRTGSFTVKYPRGEVKVAIPIDGIVYEFQTDSNSPDDYANIAKAVNQQFNAIEDQIHVVQQLQETIAPLVKQQTDQEQEALRLLNDPNKKLSYEERSLLENFVDRRTQILKIQWELDRKEYEDLKEEASTLLGFDSKQEYDVLWEKLFELIPPLKWREVNKSITESDSQKLKQYTEIYDRLNYCEMQRLGIEYSEKQDAKAINLLPSTKEKKQLIACSVLAALGGTAIITTIVLASLGVFGGAGAPVIPIPIVGSTNNGNNDNNNDNKNNAA